MIMQLIQIVKCSTRYYPAVSLHNQSHLVGATDTMSNTNDGILSTLFRIDVARFHLIVMVMVCLCHFDTVGMFTCSLVVVVCSI